MEEVLKSLKAVEGVKEAHSTYGIYDVIAKVEAETSRGRLGVRP